jgi:hypothetical protein
MERREVARKRRLVAASALAVSGQLRRGDKSRFEMEIGNRRNANDDQPGDHAVRLRPFEIGASQHVRCIWDGRVPGHLGANILRLL